MAEIDLQELRITVAVLEDHPEGEPIPMRIKRCEQEPNVWAAPHNGVVYGREEIARSAFEMSTQAYRERQRSRMEASRLVRATPVEASNYLGWVTLNGDGDDYFSSPYELLDHCHDVLELAKPAYCWGTEEHHLKFDVLAQLQCHIHDNHHEDAADHLVDVEGLTSFFEAWCAKQTIISYFIDYSTVVVLDERQFQHAVAQARDVLAGGKVDGR